MLVQVQEAGQFGIRDKLGMLLVTEDSTHIDCENYDNMVEYKIRMPSHVQGISHTSCGHVPHSIHFGGIIEVFDLQGQHMLVCVHSSNERPGILYCNKQPVYNENKLGVCGLNPQQTHNCCMSWWWCPSFSGSFF
jgi:phenylpropionate dioxygenase-like ring-hydroxylating dioxygenase large terminal subunit